MRTAALIIGFFLFIVISSHNVFAQRMFVDMSTSKNDIVSERIELYFTSDEAYNSISFVSTNKPLSVIYDSDYSVMEEGDYYVIGLSKKVSTGENNISFSVIYDGLVDSYGRQKVLRTSFNSIGNAGIEVNLSLPKYFVLSEKEPMVIPKPTAITSDGQRVKIHWETTAKSFDISVFYENETSYRNILIMAFVMVVAASLGFFILHRTFVRKSIAEMLSDEERMIIDEVRNGLLKQKEIAVKIGFSKSKMSKLVRKLEEKGLVEKKPYFKTNLIKLRGKIR